MPKVFYCLKCSKAVYEHSRGCMSKTTKIFHYTRMGASCELESPEYNYTRTYKPHKLVDLHRKPYCSWERDYIQLRRVYIRRYNPAGWNAIGWYCPHCGNFIKT